MQQTQTTEMDEKPHAEAMDVVETGNSEDTKPKLTRRNVLLIMAIAMAMVAGGAVNGMIATTLAQPSFIVYFDLDTGDPTSLIGATNGMFYGGGAIGVFFGAWAADKFGRRKALAANCILSTCWQALQAGSVHIGMFIAFRFFSGFNAAIFVTLTPLYQSEIAPPHLRGLLVGLAGIGNIIGYHIATWSGVGFFHAPAGVNQWRFPFVILGGLCLIVLALLPFIPESPRWLLMQGRQAEAEAIIKQIHTTREGTNHRFAELELQQMELQITEERELAVSYFQLLTSKKWRRRAWLCILVGLLGQSTGALVINNYGPYFYSMLGMDSEQQMYLSGGYLTCNFVFAFVGIAIVDKVGRVKLMVFASIGQIICLIIEAAIVANNPLGDNRSMNIAGVFIFYLYTAIYGVGWDCAQFTYIAELMPTPLRAKGVTLGIASLYLCNVAYLTGVLYAFSQIGWKYFLVFITISPFLVALMWIFAPETKGKTLEEIGALFGDKLAGETLEELGSRWDQGHKEEKS